MVGEARQNDVSMRPYLVTFAAWYVPLATLSFIVAQSFSFASSFYLLAPFVAAGSASGKFLKTNRRAPTDAERDRLVNGSMSIWLCMSAIMLVIWLVLEWQADRLPEPSLALVFFGVFAAIILFGMTCLLLLIVYGWSAKKQAEKLNR